MDCEFMTTTQIAEMLGVSQRTVVDWCKTGSLKAYKPGGRNFIIKRADFEAFLDSKVHKG